MNYPEDKGRGVEIQKLKALELEKKISELKIKKGELENEIVQFKSLFKRVEDIIFDMDKIGRTQEMEQMHSEGKMLVDKHDFEELLDISKRQYILENRLKRIEKENESLKKQLKEAVGTIEDKNEELEGKKKLKNELSTAVAMLKKTDNQFRMLSDFLKSIDQFGKAREYMLEIEKSKRK